MYWIMKGAAALILSALTLIPPAWADEDGDKHCPSGSRAGHNYFTGRDMDADRVRIGTLGESVAKAAIPVCILVLIDPEEPGYSKKLAIRRAVWARDILVKNGVPRNTIAVELRMADPVQTKDDLRQIDIILSR